MAESEFEPRAHALKGSAALWAQLQSPRIRARSQVLDILPCHCSSPKEGWPPGDASSVVCPRGRGLRRSAVVFRLCHRSLTTAPERDAGALRGRSWDNEIRPHSLRRPGQCPCDRALDLTCSLCFHGREDCKLCGCLLSPRTFP